MFRVSKSLATGLSVALALTAGHTAQQSDRILPAGTPPPVRVTGPEALVRGVSQADAAAATPGNVRVGTSAPAPFPAILPPNVVQGLNPAGAPSDGGMLAPGCTAGEVYDDGTAESGLGGCGFGTVIIDVSRFTPPSYPYSYDQVCVSWTQTGGDTALNYDIVMYDDDGAGGGPGTFLGAVPVSASGIPVFPAVSPFFDYSVSFPAVDSGSVWIGTRFDESVDQCFFVSADTSGSHPHYSSVDGGVTFAFEPTGPLNLMIRAEGNVAACGDGEVYDDGSAESGLGWSLPTGDVIVLNQFSPSTYPLTYDEICLSWTQTGGDPSISFDLVLFDDDGTGGQPGTLLHSVPASATGVPLFPAVSPVESYSFPGAPAVYEGNVWIGARWNAATEPSFFVGSDTSGNHPDYHTSDGGATWSLDLGGSQNLQIRADGTTFCEEGEIYDDGTAENGFGNAFTYVQVSRFTPASYPFTYDEVCVGWTQTIAPGGTASLDYQIVIYDDNGVAGGPGTRLAEVDASASGIPDFFGSQVYAYYRHVLDCAPEITSGSVWIGVDWDGIAQPGRFLAVDTSGNHPDYTDQNGAGFVLDIIGNGTYMVRAGFSGDGADVTATATFRNAGSNPASLSTGLPILGSTISATVDLTTTGHNFAYVGAYASPLNFTLPGGQVLLHNIADPGGELLGQALMTGPIANFSIQGPIDLAICGFTASVQAAHIGGVQPFALSNAIDWVAGR